MLSECLKGWTPYDAGGFCNSYWKASTSMFLKACVISLSSPGTWYVEIHNFSTGELHRTPADRDGCFTSLMDALYYADGYLNEYGKLQ
jgi:hypothetical protein